MTKVRPKRGMIFNMGYLTWHVMLKLGLEGSELQLSA
jgi:hypothetical protein